VNAAGTPAAGLVSKREASTLALRATAAEIARLLAEAVRGTVTLDSRPLRPVTSPSWCAPTARAAK